jgi:FlaA1/EpsC-like NDP-sugar epimerase
MPKFSVKQFLFQIALWLAVAIGILSFKSLFGVPRAITAALLLTLFLGFVAYKLFGEFGREQRFIAVGVTLSSAAILLLLIVKFYIVNFELRSVYLAAIFLAPLIVSGLVHGWRENKK